MNNNSNIAVERYLNSVYLSLARPVEITFKDGTVADGFFGGLDYATGNILIRNFCIYGTIVLEAERKINMSEIKFFVVKGVERPQSHIPKKRAENEHADIKDDVKKNDASKKIKDNSLIYVKNNESLSFSKKKITKTNKQTIIKETLVPMTKVSHKNQYGFLTDKEISNKNVLDKRGSTFSNNKLETKPKDDKFKDKVFEKWKPDMDIHSVEIHELGINITEERFDQFELNHIINNERAEEFTEDDYTTKLQFDDFTEEDILIADRLAQEILNAENTHDINTNHILEERGLKALVDNEDEEALYSAVIDTNCAFKFKTEKPSSKRKCFYELIIKNWSKGKRKASELIETLSKPIDNKSGNNSFTGIKQNGGGVYKGMYNVGQNAQYGNIYMAVS